MIKYVGENLTIAENLLPDGSIIITEGLNTFDIKWQIIFGLIVVLIMFIIAFINRKKIMSLLKEEQKSLKLEQKNKTNNQNILYAFKILAIIALVSFIPVILSPLHELLHAIFYGGDVEIGFTDGYMVVNPLNTMSKFRYLLAGLAPVLILSIIPFILVNILLYKNKIKIFKYLIIVLFSICMLSSTLPDLVCIYNISRYVPNGAILQQIDGEIYYYRN